MIPSLAGKVAVVTGGARGIGGACSELLRESGATVYVVDLESDEPIDVTDRAALDRLAARVDDEHGGLDVLINAAGVLTANLPIDEQPTDDFRRNFEVNVLGIAASKRSAVFPDIKTTVEAGYPGSDYNFWMGSYIPSKTPRAIVERLNAEVQKALQDAEIRKKIAALGGEIELMGVDRFNDFIAKERVVNAEIVKMIGFKPQGE